VKLPKRSGKVQSAVCLQHDLQASVGFSQRRRAIEALEARAPPAPVLRLWS